MTLCGRATCTAICQKVSFQPPLFLHGDGLFLRQLPQAGSCKGGSQYDKERAKASLLDQWPPASEGYLGPQDIWQMSRHSSSNLEEGATDIQWQRPEMQLTSSIVADSSHKNYMPPNISKQVEKASGLEPKAQVKLRVFPFSASATDLHIYLFSRRI